ncbi:hypothetical protein [Gloeocapsa sp. PCC 7428]|uniref:hypothetical protein n=1 Tax=Gloeocapsa sp. PCC 7428 TaxID=1173026 RepID=UPI0002E5A5E5|nr:hypothetical protein [Gloeocapsa sp. PCC 7428]
MICSFYLVKWYNFKLLSSGLSKILLSVKVFSVGRKSLFEQNELPEGASLDAAIALPTLS